MNNATTDNFLKAMSEFKWPDPAPVTFRLYYNDDGSFKCYSMEDLPGKYIEVDQETYVLARGNVRVINSKLHIIEPAVTIQKLQPNTSTGTPCHVADVCIVVALDQPHIKWDIVTNETY